MNLRTPDSLRWCELCKDWGDHHTDRCGEIPWHTEQDVTHAMEEMRNHLAREAEVTPSRAWTSYQHRCRRLRDELLRTAGQEVLADLARVALGMKPERR